LGLAGGSTIAETVRAVMKRLMQSSCAKDVNWKGKGGKLSFASLTLKSVVCGMLPNLLLLLTIMALV